MSTERIVEAAATMLETWAASLRASAQLVSDQIQAGDPKGVGVVKLEGMWLAYTDVAEALQASADHARGRRTDEGPLLRAVQSTNEEKEPCHMEENTP